MSSNSSAYMRKYYKRKRREVIEALGDKCAKCGCIDYHILEIDHKNGYKGKLSPNNSRGGFRNLWDAVKAIREGRKSEYQLLCKDCNIKDRWGV